MLKFLNNIENYNVIESLRWDYCQEEVIVKLFSSEEFDDEFLEDILVTPYPATHPDTHVARRRPDLSSPNTSERNDRMLSLDFNP